MITLTREEAQQVLDVLKDINKLSVGVNAIFLPAEIDEVMETLRAKLSEPEIQLGITYEEANQPEPVAIVQQEAFGRGQVLWATPASQVQDGTPLYTAPPQREWVGLTDDELEFYTEELGQGELGRGVLRAVVDFLKEKNG